MAISKNANRQYPLVARIAFTYADPVEATATALFDVPPNAIVIGGHVAVTTNWNSATSATLDIGDGGDDDRYTSTIINLKTATYVALTPTGYKYTVQDTIDAIVTNTGTPSAGAAEVVLEYIIVDRGHEVQPVQS